MTPAMDVEKSSALNVEEKPASIWKIIAVASIAAGVQFGWALQLSLLTPYVQTLGVPHAYATLVWLCGPLSGFIVQPLVGYLSDNCKARIGRRRPFIIAGAACICTAVFLIGFAKDIGHRAGDALDAKTKGRAVAVFVVGFWILDVSNNMLQGPTRAFLADLSNEDHRMMRIGNSCFSFFMAVGNVLGYAAGSFSDLHKIFPFSKTVACDTTCANLKSCFTLDIILLVAVVGVACFLVGEKPLSDENKQSGEKAEELNFIHQLAKSIRTMKKPVWILLLVTCINWMAWFPFILYDTDWMGREVYGGLPEGTEVQKDLYDRGVRAGALGLLLNSVVLGVSSIGVEPIGRLLGGPKNLWGFVNVILAVGLACTVWVSKAADSWRSRHGLVLPAVNVRAGGLAIFAILGVPLAITFSLPFALASIYCSMAGGGQGLSLGVVNLAIVIPQILISVVSGPLDKAFGGGNLPAFVFGAVAAVVSSFLAVFLLPKPPKRALSEVPPVLPAAAAH